MWRIGRIGSAAAIVLLLLGSMAAPAEQAALPSADEVRERRLYREENPLWRRAFALPADALRLGFWPLQQTLFWVERVNLPERIVDAVMFPVRAVSGEDEEP